MTIRCLFAIVPAALTVCLAASAARAAEPETLRQEIAGVELAPFSLGTGNSAAGLGITLRLGRHRWDSVYWTPIQGGFFAGGDGFKESVMLKLQTEAGWIGHYAGGSIELGLGAGAGLVAMQTAANGCDGSCGVGGKGLMLSPTVRFLFRERPTHTVGAFIRAEVPVGSTEGESLVYLRGFGMMFLVGLDLAGGWR